MELNSRLAGKVRNMYIKRESETVIKKMVNMFKVVLITGPRQVGKTTVLKHLLSEEYSYVTLDDINELEIAKVDQIKAFESLSVSTNFIVQLVPTDTPKNFMELL